MAQAQQTKGTRLLGLLSVLGPAELSIGAGLGCVLAWVPMVFQSLNIVGQTGENVLDLVYLISIITLTLTFTVIALTYKSEGKLISSQPLRIASIFGMTASTAFVAIATTFSTGSAEQTVFAVAAALLSGISSAVFLMQFGMLMSKFNTKSTVAITAIGYILSSALFCLYSFFGQFESAVFAASMPPISGILRTSGANTAKGQQMVDALPSPLQEPLNDPAERAHLAHLTRALALCAALVGCANEMARTLYIQMGIVNIGSANYALIQTGASLIVGLGATVLTLVLISMRTPRAPEYCYRVLMIFLVLGALLLPANMLFPQLSVVLPYSLNAAAYQCFGVLAWVLVCGVCQRYQTASVRTFASIRAGWAAGPLVGILIARHVVHATNFSAPELYACAIFGALLIMLVSGFAFTERDLATAVNLLPTAKRRRFTDKCLAVAARCGLTSREAEIMTLFAKGRNLAYIQEELCLSKSTVSTHRQHIYQKLNVHSSQEMIDLIQAEKV